jgi:ribonuclease BN (tRNA processing enzyme)
MGILGDSRLEVTVLGSGGPIANARRVSSGYLVSIDGQARILVDTGGGTFERIGRCGVDIATLEQILLTHLHIDHSGELPAVVMHLYMLDRTKSIAVAGPTGRAGNDGAPENASAQPGVAEFIRLLFGTDGAWRYMNTFEGFAVDVHETPSALADRTVHQVPVGRILADLGVSLSAVAVPHGMMPAVAFRIDCGEESIVFSGDVSASTAALITLAKDCSLLVHDFALPEQDGPNSHLHAKPSAVGRTAQQSGAQCLLLSHFMPAIEDELTESIEIVRREYSGRIELANDLTVYPVTGPRLSGPPA